MLTSLYVFGKVGDTALFYNLCGSLQSNCVAKYVLSQEREKNPKSFCIAL